MLVKLTKAVEATEAPVEAEEQSVVVTEDPAAAVEETPGKNKLFSIELGSW